MDIGLINQRVKDALAEQREYLNLSGMGLPKVPDEVLRATFLKTLDLSNNKLEEIPLEIGNLKLTEVRLAGNPNLRLPPPEVIREGTPAILSFLRSLQEGSKVVRHGKVIVIGDGRAGKTSLIKRLVSNTFSLVENPTLHINVVHLDRPHDQDRTNLRLHIWDFGGQEIFQTTHLHFLTDDSLVLLVWNVQSDQSGKGVRNWLERIDNSAPKARILLVATHADVPELTIRVS